MSTINEIVQRFSKDYLNEYSARMLPSHLKALDSIANCRTEAMGGHREWCSECGKEFLVFHSCRNRSCPQCFAKRTFEWLQVQRKRLLPTPYFHLVFTLPSELREVVQRNQKALYPVLFRAAAESLQALAADPKFVGGQLGIIEVLHTWSGAMIYHPHVHCLVPAGGMDEQGKWKSSRPNFLVPVKALSAKFRGRFLALARKAVPQEDFSKAGDQKKWVVFSKKVEQKKATKVLEYLGRYIHRIAITNRRILKVEDNGIRFVYKKPQRKQQKRSWSTMTLEPMKFLYRFLQHVLPKGLAKVRYYGFLAPAAKNKFKLLQQQLKLHTEQEGPEEPSEKEALERFKEHRRCPECQKGFLEVLECFPPQPLVAPS